MEMRYWRKFKTAGESLLFVKKRFLNLHPVKGSRAGLQVK